jgi:hypothetical protein
MAMENLSGEDSEVYSLLSLASRGGERHADCC